MAINGLLMLNSHPGRGCENYKIGKNGTPCRYIDVSWWRTLTPWTGIWSAVDDQRSAMVSPRANRGVRGNVCVGAGLAVMPRKVGQAGDRWLASDSGVGSVMIVGVEPARQGGVAFFG